jgi:hypothetical protein
MAPTVAKHGTSAASVHRFVRGVSSRRVHSTRSLRRFFASSQRTKSARPSRTAAIRPARPSPCHCGKGTSSGRRDRSSHSLSISSSFSATLNFSSDTSVLILISPCHKSQRYCTTPNEVKLAVAAQDSTAANSPLGGPRARGAEDHLTTPRNRWQSVSASPRLPPSVASTFPCRMCFACCGWPHKTRDGYVRFPCPRCQQFNTAVNPETNLGRCFRCGENYSPIDFLRSIRECDFQTAMEYRSVLLPPPPPKGTKV